MKITLKYFGLIAEITNTAEEVLDINHPVEVGALRNLLAKKYAPLGSATYQVAINHSIAGQDRELNANDEVALLPPFAGG